MSDALTSASHRARLVLSVVETDSTFERAQVRGGEAFVGRCIFCQAKLVVPLDGEAETNVTVEHIVPRTHGGTDQPENLALACRGCNGEKGRRHDNRERNDPRRIEVTRALLERRKARWPEGAREPRWPSVDHPGLEPAPEPEAPGPEPLPLSLSGIYVYPLKSARGTAVAEARLTDRGLENDRRYMIVDAKGRFVSQREHPRLSLVSPTLTEAGLRLSAPGLPDLEVETPGERAPLAPATVWDDTVEALDAGPDAASWLSRFLGQPCRLVYMPDESTRLVDPSYARRGELVSFADAFPLLLITEASLGDLNERLDAPVPMSRFRPNLVVSGARPFAEDRWAEVRIGGVKLRLVKPCSRCTIVTVDPETGETSPEPLRTLSGYRKQGSKVMFGQNALGEGRGVLRVGDALEVVSEG